MPSVGSLAAPLANRVYRRLFLAQVSALGGTGVMTVALALLAYELAGQAAGAVLGIALTLRILAFVLISPVVGAYAHLLPRRRLLVGLDLVRTGTVLLLPLVDAVWQVYLLVFLINACSAGFTPLFQATLPDVLPDEAEYTRALSLSRLAYDLEQLLSPTIAGLLLLALSFDALFALNGVAFLISAALIRSCCCPSRPPPSGPKACSPRSPTACCPEVALRVPPGVLPERPARQSQFAIYEAGHRFMRKADSYAA